MMLAAGQSRRFGSDKRRARLADGRTLLQASAAAVLAAELPLALCIRPTEEDLAHGLGLSEVRILPCTRAADGMGATLAQGVAQLPDWHGVLIALADMPWIRPDTYRRLAQALPQAGLCRPLFRGRAGHPVGFSRAWFTQLAQLRGDCGARRLLAEQRERLVLLPCDDAGVLRDVDHPADLAGD